MVLAFFVSVLIVLKFVGEYGNEMAEKIQMRIDEIKAADTVEEMIQFHIGRCHPLVHNRKGQ